MLLMGSYDGSVTNGGTGWICYYGDTDQMCYKKGHITDLLLIGELEIVTDMLLMKL